MIAKARMNAVVAPTRKRPPKAGWSWIDNRAIDDALLDVPVSARWVYVVLTRHSRNGVAEVFMAKLADATGLRIRSCQLALRALEKAGLVRTEYRKDKAGRNAKNRCHVLELAPPASPPTDPLIDGERSCAYGRTRLPAKKDSLSREDHDVQIRF